MGNDELFRNRSGINRTVAAKTLPLSVNYDPGYSGISGLSLSTVDLPLVSRNGFAIARSFVSVVWFAEKGYG